MSTHYDLDDMIMAERQRSRRERDLAQIPEQVAILARAYVDAGGDPGELVQAVTADTEPPTE